MSSHFKQGRCTVRSFEVNKKDKHVCEKSQRSKHCQGVNVGSTDS